MVPGRSPIQISLELPIGCVAKFFYTPVSKFLMRVQCQPPKVYFVCYCQSTASKTLLDNACTSLLSSNDCSQMLKKTRRLVLKWGSRLSDWLQYAEVKHVFLAVDTAKSKERASANKDTPPPPAAAAAAQEPPGDAINVGKHIELKPRFVDGLHALLVLDSNRIEIAISANSSAFLGTCLKIVTWKSKKSIKVHQF